LLGVEHDSCFAAPGAVGRGGRPHGEDARVGGE
jgi:hypothetical protein